MAYTDVDQVTVLERILARLRDQLALDDRRCFLTWEPTEPTLPPGGDFFLSVAFAEGRFPEDMQVGGGAAQCVENTTVAVSIYSRVFLDTVDQSDRHFLEAARGLLSKKKSVLAALVGHNLTTEGGSTFLRQHLFAIGSMRPVYNPEAGIARLTLTFGVDYDWDLT